MRLDGREVHASVTVDRVVEASERRMASLDNPGICIACGADQDGCEPDARRYQCEACEADAVYGAEELLIMMVV